MSADIDVQALGINTKLRAKDEKLEMKKLEKEFQGSLKTVVAELNDIEFRSSDEIAVMSNEEFFLELESLDNQYEQKIKGLLEKQIKKEEQTKKEALEKEKLNKEFLKLELKNQKTEKKLQAKHVGDLKAMREEFEVQERESKISINKNAVESFSLALKNYSVGSYDYDQTLSLLANAQKTLEELLSNST